MMTVLDSKMINCKCGHDKEAHSILLGVCGKCFNEKDNQKKGNISTDWENSMVTLSMPEGYWNHQFKENRNEML